MSITRYGYSDAFSGFFEFPTENARRILPKHLEPAELHHGSSIFAMTVFDFTESEVGSYGEVVMAVIVAPLVSAGERLPHSAFFPYLVATTTKEAREHAIERWRLPHWMEDIGVEFSRAEGRIEAKIGAAGAAIADLAVTEHSWNPVSHLYQSFMEDDEASYMARITMEGNQSEHEEETGKLTLHEHPFNAELELEEIYDVPFREIWMREGQQLFDPLTQLQTA